MKPSSWLVNSEDELPQEDDEDEEEEEEEEEEEDDLDDNEVGQEFEEPKLKPQVKMEILDWQRRLPGGSAQPGRFGLY